MNNYRVRIKMIITDYMDLEAEGKEAAILKVTDLLNKCVDGKVDLTKTFNSRPNFIFDIEEIDEE